MDTPRTSPIRAAWPGALALVIALALVMGLTLTPSGAQASEADEKHCRKFQSLGLPLLRGDFSFGQHKRICRPGYALLHNTETKNPDWVVELLTRKNLRGTAKRKNNFKVEPNIPGGENKRAELCNYKKSGFDRGHQAPAADFKRDQELMNDSFYLSNMAPQVGPSFNRGIWARLEERVRDLVRSRRRLYVITGPVYDAPDLGGPDKEFIWGTCEKEDDRSGVAVPDGFYKILYDPRRKRALAFLFPNARLRHRKVTEFRTFVREVEELTGLNFFPRMSRRTQNILELNVAEMWNW
ncbi:MAG: DNA/RNA non-specific endonuclease [Nitrospinaceae bacterium]